MPQQSRKGSGDQGVIERHARAMHERLLALPETLKRVRAEANVADAVIVAFHVGVLNRSDAAVIRRELGESWRTGSILAPIRNASGAIAGFAQVVGENGNLLVRRPRPPIMQAWNEPIGNASGECILCSSILDALAVISALEPRSDTIVSVVPSGWCPPIEGGISSPPRMFLLAHSATRQGDEDAALTADALLAAGHTVRRVRWQRGLNPSAMSLTSSGLQALRSALDHARTVAGSTSPESMVGAVRLHLESRRLRGESESTCTSRAAQLELFRRWCAERHCVTIAAVSPELVLDYQRFLDLARTAEGLPLTTGTKRNRLVALRRFAEWAIRTERLSVDPTRRVVLPRAPKHLPRAVLSLPEAERVLAQPETGTLLGLRDRAILELLLSTGLRRMELIALDLPDIDFDRQLVLVREGKGSRDRVVPIGARALAWLDRYLSNARPLLTGDGYTHALFLGAHGDRMSRTRLTERLHAYLVAAGVRKSGSCHVWRHTMATLMHDGGADVRDLQVILGHAQLSTTAIYTQVSAARLVKVHRESHPLS